MGGEVQTVVGRTGRFLKKEKDRIVAVILLLLMGPIPFYMDWIFN
jgi:acetylornithine/succinyldiaminopimelate/putrescine aminotransferase